MKGEFTRIFYTLTSRFIAAFVLSICAAMGDQNNRLKIILDDLVSSRSFEAFGSLGLFLSGLLIIFYIVQNNFNNQGQIIVKFISGILTEASKSLSSMPFSLTSFVTGLIAYSYLTGDLGEENIGQLISLTLCALGLLAILALAPVAADRKSNNCLACMLYSNHPVWPWSIGTALTVAPVWMMWNLANS